MGMELIYSQNNSAVPLMKKICCGALMLKTSPTAGGASEPAVDTCRLCGNACCRPCRNKAARHAQRRQHNQLSARHESVLLSKISAGQTPCSGPQVSRLRRSCTPQVNCGYSGVAASVSPCSASYRHNPPDSACCRAPHMPSSHALPRSAQPSASFPRRNSSAPRYR